MKFTYCQVMTCDVGKLMKEGYYEINLAIIEIFELCYDPCLMQ